MIARLRQQLSFAGLVALFACSAWAQTTTLEGNVKDPGGQPIKGAVIKLDRTDIKGHYQVKSDKKGPWFYTGLPFGTYDVSCEVDGKVADKVSGVKSKYGDSTVVDFDLAKSQQQQAAAAAAAGGAPGAAGGAGEATQEQARGMSKEQKAQYDAQL